MIAFEKKREPALPLPGESDENRFDRIRRIAADKHRRAETPRRDRQLAIKPL